ncbi:hypothetical protein EV641_11483 [Rhodococcus sp. SMB37]|nr:hypothetical protein EV641_11483 [Rhodococcus sp. SMB37]
MTVGVPKFRYTHSHLALLLHLDAAGQFTLPAQWV